MIPTTYLPAWRRLAVLCATLLLAACASQPTASAPWPARSDIERFSLDARFALRTDETGSEPQQASGRLYWQHLGQNDERILLMNPLGHGIAEIEITPQGSRLRQGKAQELSAADAETLLHDATGQHLPLARLPDWLLGRSHHASIERDDYGRPMRLRENAWQIDYTYGTDDAEALPERLHLTYRAPQRQIDLHLRIEEWRAP